MQSERIKNWLISSVIVALLNCYGMAVFAVTANAGNTSSQQTVTTQAPQTGKVEYCPEVTQLVRKGLWWGASGSWRSYSTSLVKEVSNFVGAQWVGINVGVIICIYKGQNATDFPVTVQRSIIVPMPTSQGWIRELQSGRMDCYSNQVTDCPFVVPVHTQQSIQQVYQDLQSFKKNNSNTNKGP